MDGQGPGGTPEPAWTSDNGCTWTVWRLATKASETAVPTGPSVGWAVGDDQAWQPPPGTVFTPFAHGPYAPQVLLRTVDGGTGWRMAERPGSGPGWSAPLLAASSRHDRWLLEGSAALRMGVLRGPILFQSTDWCRTGRAFALPPAFTGGPRVTARPSALNASTAWLPTGTGLWRTTDGGASWLRVARA